MVEIRPGTAADLDHLREIQQQTLAEPWPELLETAVGAGPALFVATDLQPVGYAIVIPGPDDVAYLPELAVAPGRQREGIGAAILDTACDHLRSEGFDELRLTVMAADDGARAFYRSNAFDKIDRLEDEYESGDGILMARSL